VSQKQIFAILLNTGAPPVLAATAPKNIKNNIELAYCHKIIVFKGAKMDTASGNSAPAKNEANEANAACKGLAADISVMPNSSRRWV